MTNLNPNRCSKYGSTLRVNRSLWQGKANILISGDEMLLVRFLSILHGVHFTSGRCCSHRRRAILYQTPQNTWDCPVSPIFCLTLNTLSSLRMPCTWRSCVSQRLIPELRQLELHGNGLLWLYEDCICWRNSAILMKSERLECFFLLTAMKRPHQRPPTGSWSWIRKTGYLLISS